MRIICPVCKNEVPANLKYCPFCGTQLPNSSDNTIPEIDIDIEVPNPRKINFVHYTANDKWLAQSLGEIRKHRNFSRFEERYVMNFDKTPEENAEEHKKEYPAKHLSHRVYNKIIQEVYRLSDEIEQHRRFIELHYRAYLKDESKFWFLLFNYYTFPQNQIYAIRRFYELNLQTFINYPKKFKDIEDQLNNILESLKLGNENDNEDVRKFLKEIFITAENHIKVTLQFYIQNIQSHYKFFEAKIAIEQPDKPENIENKFSKLDPKITLEFERITEYMCDLGGPYLDIEQKLDEVVSGEYQDLRMEILEDRLKDVEEEKKLIKEEMLARQNEDIIL